MTRGIQLIVLGVAVAVNGVALAVLDVAMVQVADHEKLAMQQPARIAVTGQKLPSRRLLAARSCPDPEQSL